MKFSSLELACELATKRFLPSALSLGILTFSLSGLAQEANTPPSAEPPQAEEGEAETTPAAEGDEATEAPPEEATTETAKPEPPAEPEPVPAPQVSADAETPSTETTADSTETAADVAVPPPLRLELLPSTAYPNDPINGIRGGSMELSINQQQWPYMPKYEGPPALRVGISGSGWVDSNFRTVKAGLETERNEQAYRQQGRFTLRVTPTYTLEKDWFLQANTEFIGNVDQDRSTTNYVDIDGAWLRFGKWKVFDIQAGRMQGFEVYHTGMGLDLNTYERSGAVSFSESPPQIYGLTDLWDYGVSNGAVAAHLYLPKWLRLEMLTRFGRSNAGSDFGIRPVGVVDLGWLKLKGGYERRLRASIFQGDQARTETQGIGASAQFVWDPWLEGGLNIGQRVEDAFENDGAIVPTGTHTTLSYGGFLNARPYFEGWLVGVGYNRTQWENFHFDAFGNPETTDHDQMFGAVQYLLWDRLYIKYVLAYAKADFKKRSDASPTGNSFTNETLSHRLRLMMNF